MLCPCSSGKPYIVCCKRYHKGVNPPDALKLMRSRYSAYALGLVDYIVTTTHPDNPTYTNDKLSWMTSIAAFCEDTAFTGLDIIDFADGTEEAFVTFTAHLEQEESDASFTERSRFVKVESRWLYHSGEIKKSLP